MNGERVIATALDGATFRGPIEGFPLWSRLHPGMKTLCKVVAVGAPPPNPVADSRKRSVIGGGTRPAGPEAQAPPASGAVRRGRGRSGVPTSPPTQERHLRLVAPAGPSSP